MDREAREVAGVNSDTGGAEQSQESAGLPRGETSDEIQIWGFGVANDGLSMQRGILKGQLGTQRGILKGHSMPPLAYVDGLALLLRERVALVVKGRLGMLVKEILQLWLQGRRLIPPACSIFSGRAQRLPVLC